VASISRRPSTSAWEQTGPISSAGDGVVYRYAFAEGDAPPPGQAPDEAREYAHLAAQISPPGEGAPPHSDAAWPFIPSVYDAPPDAALAYNRWRHYDPTPGVWLTEDEVEPGAAAR
jgi:hypothetical protein